MLGQIEKVKQRWGGHDATIDTWLHARQQLLVQYCELVGLNEEKSALPDAGKINLFCEYLMDYLSAGHFEVYDLLVSDDDAGSRLKDQVYPRIAETTDHALRFNDAYTDAVSVEQAQSFDADLSQLGEVLATRFEFEDHLINHMYHHHVVENEVDKNDRPQ